MIDIWCWSSSCLLEIYKHLIKSLPKDWVANDIQYDHTNTVQYVQFPHVNLTNGSPTTFSPQSHCEGIFWNANKLLDTAHTTLLFYVRFFMFFLGFSENFERSVNSKVLQPTWCLLHHHPMPTGEMHQHWCEKCVLRTIMVQWNMGPSKIGFLFN